MYNIILRFPALTILTDWYNFFNINGFKFARLTYVYNDCRDFSLSYKTVHPSLKI